MKKKISYDDLMCVCELADLYLKNQYSKFWEVETEIVKDFKWFLLQCNTETFTISTDTK